MVEWLKTILEFLSTLAWPVVVIWIAFLFREHLEGLLGRVSKFSAAGVSAEFELGKEIKKLSKAVHASLEGDSQSGLDTRKSTGGVLQHSEDAPNGTPKSFLNQARELVSSSPMAAVMVGRVALEQALREQQFFNGEGRQPRSVMQMLESLRPALGNDLFKQSASALRIANKASHGDADGLTVQLANELLDTIEILIDEIANVKPS